MSTHLRSETGRGGSEGVGRMMLCRIRKETVVEAPPEAVFDLVADPTRHPELAGSGEVLDVHLETEGPVAIGTRFEAREDIPVDVAKRTFHRRFVAESEVLVHNPPHTFSWRSAPAGKKPPRKLQWWFRLSPEGGSTRVVHELEIDFGPMMNLVLKAPFRRWREGTVERGMERTLDNLRRMAEHDTETYPGG